MAKLIINPTSGAKKEIPVGDKALSNRTGSLE